MSARARSYPLAFGSTAHMALLHPFLPRAAFARESQERLLIARPRVNYRALRARYRREHVRYSGSESLQR